jgi:hypothetical protein
VSQEPEDNASDAGEDDEARIEKKKAKNISKLMRYH